MGHGSAGRRQGFRRGKPNLPLQVELKDKVVEVDWRDGLDQSRKLRSTSVPWAGVHLAPNGDYPHGGFREASSEDVTNRCRKWESLEWWKPHGCIWQHILAWISHKHTSSLTPVALNTDSVSVCSTSTFCFSSKRKRLHSTQIPNSGSKCVWWCQYVSSITHCSMVCCRMYCHLIVCI